MADDTHSALSASTPSGQGVDAKRKFSSRDLVAGLCVAGLLLPEAVAYSGLAHLPVAHALVGMLAGLLIYALFGGSRFAIVAPTSSSATLAAAAVLSMPLVGNGSLPAVPTEAYVQALLALVLLAGAALMTLAAMKQGQLSAFVSRPVLRGFAFALAITIVIKQLPDAMGLHLPQEAAHDLLRLLLYVFSHFPEWHWPTVLVSLAAAAGLVLFKRWPQLPASMIVIVLAIVAANTLGLKAMGVEEVGAIAWPSFKPSLPNLPLNEWLRLAELAFGLVVLIFAESWGSMRTLALAHGDTLNANRELMVLGGCNVASALLQGMPVGAGFSASSANASAGATSRAAGAIALGVILLALIFALPALHALPRPVLAIAVISALWHSLNPAPIIKVWAMRRDRLLITAAVIAVLWLGVLHGMLAAIALSLIEALRRFSQPVVHELGKLSGTRNYVVLEAHPEASRVSGILILRPEEPLFFASADRVVNDVMQHLETQTQAQTGVRTVVLSLEESSDLDSTALECLMELRQRLQARHITLALSRVKDTVRELFKHCDPQGLGDEKLIFWSVDDAVQAMHAFSRE